MFVIVSEASSLGEMYFGQERREGDEGSWFDCETHQLASLDRQDPESSFFHP